MVAHLLNIDDTLATVVSGGLGLPELPQAFPATVEPRQDLLPSDALSIIKNAPKTFEGRKLGILVSDGAPAVLVNALIEIVEKLPAVYEIVAPKIAGAVLDDGTLIEAKQKIDGGPSILYDAVAVILSPDGAAMLAGDKTAKDFVSDAFGHAKFIACNAEALPLLHAAGVSEKERDDGVVTIASAKDAKAFITLCGEVRFWNREFNVDLDAAGFLEANKG
ncbi:MAG: hypothetical protein DI555_21450 [Novosphingobium pentaromativorans]|uniref:catalase n=1 Tax=Novosphingobium pentaromativorans TaxID=205844 RepID=A0A2W5NFY4_9SPHN|nr:MAG: hypothetical protein DI555_21450 [Novosphingobium pentaromativorans]